MELCAACEDAVPVLGDYVAFAPNGSVVCGDCLAGDDGEPQAPGIVRGL